MENLPWTRLSDVNCPPAEADDRRTRMRLKSQGGGATTSRRNFGGYYEPRTKTCWRSGDIAVKKRVSCSRVRGNSFHPDLGSPALWRAPGAAFILATRRRPVSTARKARQGDQHARLDCRPHFRCIRQGRCLRAGQVQLIQSHRSLVGELPHTPDRRHGGCFPSAPRVLFVRRRDGNLRNSTYRRDCGRAHDRLFASICGADYPLEPCVRFPSGQGASWAVRSTAREPPHRRGCIRLCRQYCEPKSKR